MSELGEGAPPLRAVEWQDLRVSLQRGWSDFRAAPAGGLAFATVYVLAGLFMATITYQTGTTFWLILAVLGFPLIGAFAALGLYEISRRRDASEPIHFNEVSQVVLSHRGGQLPWLAVLIVVVFLFWFFIGHMIFALFLGLAPMTNVSTDLTVYLSPQGLQMLAVGGAVGAGFAVLVFSMSVIGMPMILDRDVDFMTAMITSIAAVRSRPSIYLAWGLFIGAVTFIAMIPAFLGLFVVLPVLGHATWHLYKRVTSTT